MRQELEQAIELLHNQGPEGLADSVSLLQQTVYSFSMKVCGHREDAEDTAQDVLLKAVPYLAKFDSSRALGVWLYKVAKNRCLMNRRKSKFAPTKMVSLEELMPTREELEALATTRDQSPESVLLHQERSETLLNAIQTLPPDYRLVLVLHDMEEVPTADVAQILSLQEGTVRVRLHRARLMLRKELGKGLKRSSRPASQAEPVRTEKCKQMFAALSDYLDNTEDQAARNKLEKHLADCPPCQTFLQALQQTVQQCRDCPSPQLTAKAAAQLRSKFLKACRKADLAAAASSPR